MTTAAALLQVNDRLARIEAMLAGSGMAWLSASEIRRDLRIGKATWLAKVKPTLTARQFPNGIRYSRDSLNNYLDSLQPQLPPGASRSLRGANSHTSRPHYAGEFQPTAERNINHALPTR